MKPIYCFALAIVSFSIQAQNIQNNPGSNHGNKFEQLGTILPTPNTYRTASGAPGKDYWQQRADYTIDAQLDEKNLTIQGSELITYYNNSPDELRYLWLQLDENQHNPNCELMEVHESRVDSFATDELMNPVVYKRINKGLGLVIENVYDANDKPLTYTINQTMMRVEVPSILKPGQTIAFKIKWHYKISNRNVQGGRGGYEYFPDDGNYLFTITQWFPRMCVYSDFQGWQNKQFTGKAEFALPFGSYNVKITVPNDHVVGATGVCTNYENVLTPDQLKRWKQAQNTTEPIELVTLDEAKKAEKIRITGTKTYHFKADSVRDFAWTSSRKFIWDAMPTFVAGKRVMCMSYYPKESYGLFRKFSTKVVAHTIKTYSKYSVNYPYPVAQSVEASNGMEYPMIAFNFGRTEKDGTYSESAKYGMIGVTIHEVGHNFFPMIINSDERQWVFFDEGFNSFIQMLTQLEFDEKFPVTRGPTSKILDYMRKPKIENEPIMTATDNLPALSNNAYIKTATGLNMLRETIMGRELFDYSFKEYCRRWAFKHPTPADFFRTMEDASGIDLDWFWRGWFYGTDPCDISLDSVKTFVLNKDTRLKDKTDTIKPNPNKEPEFVTKRKNKEAGVIPLVQQDKSLEDFYTSYIADSKVPNTISKFSDKYALLSDSAKKVYDKLFYYQLNISNKGGLVMPIILKWNYADGTSEIEKIHPYIWRKNEKQITKIFAKEKEVKNIELDPLHETPDINEVNNKLTFTGKPVVLDIYRSITPPRGQSFGGNPMQKKK